MKRIWNKIKNWWENRQYKKLVKLINGRKERAVKWYTALILKEYYAKPVTDNILRIVETEMKAFVRRLYYLEYMVTVTAVPSSEGISIDIHMVEVPSYKLDPIELTVSL